MYKNWQQLLHLMREYDLNHFFTVLHETSKSIVLNHWDGYYRIYIILQRTSDKCYRMLYTKNCITIPNRQDDDYKSFRAPYEIADYLINIKSGTLPPLTETFGRQKPKRSKS